jgi:hypothetical protein
MRAARLISLVALGLLVSGFATDLRASPPSARSRSKSSAPEDKKAVWTVEVEGWGKSPDDAYQDALKKAQVEVIAFLKDDNRHFIWTPELPFVAKLVKDKHEGEDKEFQTIGLMKQQILTVGISNSDYREMAREDRIAHSDLRMIVLGKALAGLVAVFGAFAGYFRLEEATKGFYTAWLRAGAVGLVAAVGATLYWFS